MFEDTQKLENEKVILVGVYETSSDESLNDFEHSMEELVELSKACDMEPVGTFTQSLPVRTAALYIGSGKVYEIKGEAAERGATLIVLNDTLSPIQLRNLQKELDMPVLDRTALILEIFSSRARSREAKLQVELARLNYMKPRLIGMWEKQNRQGGASGAMSSKGEGETQLEIDRRTIDHRLSQMRRELKEVESARQTQRKKRERAGLPLAALVGYTNAGKSTIMNSMVARFSDEEKGVFEANMLFATLDTTVRRIDAGRNSQFLLSDTVGFIQKLPTGLVEAFKSTLEEVKEASLILHVVDYSDPHYKDHMAVTRKTIAELGAGDVPELVIYNKCDMAEGAKYPRRGPELADENGNFVRNVFVSAKEEASVTLLSEVICDCLYEDYEELSLVIPYSAGDALSYLLSHAQVSEQKYLDTGTQVAAKISKKDRAYLKSRFGI